MHILFCHVPCHLNFPSAISKHLCNNRVFFIVFFKVLSHSLIHLFIYQCICEPFGLPSCQKVWSTSSSPRRRRCGSRKSSGTRTTTCVPPRLLCGTSWMSAGWPSHGGETWIRAWTSRPSRVGPSRSMRALPHTMIGAGDFLTYSFWTVPLILHPKYALRDPFLKC